MYACRLLESLSFFNSICSELGMLEECYFVGLSVGPSGRHNVRVKSMDLGIDECMHTVFIGRCTSTQSLFASLLEIRNDVRLNDLLVLLPCCQLVLPGSNIPTDAERSHRPNATHGRACPMFKLSRGE